MSESEPKLHLVDNKDDQNGKNSTELPVLPAKHKLFADSYLKTGNATQAAKDAGYSANNAYRQGFRLLKNDLIKTYIRTIQAQVGKKLGLSSENVLATLQEIVDQCTKPGRTYNPAGANKALELIGKALGTYEAKQDQENRPAFTGLTIILGGPVDGYKRQYLELYRQLNPGKTTLDSCDIEPDDPQYGKYSEPKLPPMTTPAIETERKPLIITK